MPVVFLDFDGPLFPEKAHLYAQNQGEVALAICKQLDLHPMTPYWFADPFSVSILNELRRLNPYQLVISSSWADDRLHEKHHIAALLKANNIDFEFHPDWRTPRDPTLSRHIQIERWLLAHPEVLHYLVLDDTVSAPGFKTDSVYQDTTLLPQNIYLAHDYDGFNYAQFESMRQNVLSWPLDKLNMKAANKI